MKKIINQLKIMSIMTFNQSTQVKLTTTMNFLGANPNKLFLNLTINSFFQIIKLIFFYFYQLYHFELNLFISIFV